MVLVMVEGAKDGDDDDKEKEEEEEEEARGVLLDQEATTFHI